MKKIFLVFTSICCLFFLPSCSKKEVTIQKNYIMLSISENIDGSATQSIVFGVNSDFLRQNSKNIQEEIVFKQKLIKNVEEIRNQFLFSFASIYLQNPIEKYKINQGVLLTQVGYNNEADYVGFEIKCTSLGAWQYYHNLTASQEKQEKNHNIFY